MWVADAEAYGNRCKELVMVKRGPGFRGDVARNGDDGRAGREPMKYENVYL